MEMQMDVGLHSWYIKRCKKNRSNNSISCHEKHSCFFQVGPAESVSAWEAFSEGYVCIQPGRYAKVTKMEKWMIRKQKEKIPSFLIVQVWIFSFLKKIWLALCSRLDVFQAGWADAFSTNPVTFYSTNTSSTTATSTSGREFILTSTRRRATSWPHHKVTVREFVEEKNWHFLVPNL